VLKISISRSPHFDCSIKAASRQHPAIWTPHNSEDSVSMPHQCIELLLGGSIPHFNGVADGDGNADSIRTPSLEMSYKELNLPGSLPSKAGSRVAAGTLRFSD
jgi:hypothetical protein